MSTLIQPIFQRQNKSHTVCVNVLLRGLAQRGLGSSASFLYCHQFIQHQQRSSHASLMCFWYTRLLAEVLELRNPPFCLSSIVATSQLLLHVFLTYNNRTYPHTLYGFLPSPHAPQHHIIVCLCMQICMNSVLNTSVSPRTQEHNALSGCCAVAGWDTG